MLLKVTTNALVFGTIGKASDNSVIAFEDKVAGSQTYSDPHPLPPNQPPPGESSFFMSFTVSDLVHVDLHMDYQRFETAGLCDVRGYAVATG